MAKIESTLLDNSPNFEMVEKIKQLVKEEDVNEILIATGYWDIPGTALIANELSEFLSKDGKSIKLLIGKDPTVFASQLTEIGCTDIKNTSDAIKINLSNLKPREEYLSAVRLLQCYCEGERPKFSIHTFTNPEDTRQFFHSKCYIFTESAFTANNTDHGLYAIVGSSNFTQKGLEGNSELNYLEIQSQVIDARNNNRQKGHIEWFKEKWNLSEDWTKDFLLALNNSPIGKDAFSNTYPVTELSTVKDSSTILTPYETYIKFLQDQFAEIIDTDGKIKKDEYTPKDPNFKKLSYQYEAVNHAFSIMKRHNGCIIADVVGLGKTFTALMIAKRYLLENCYSKPILIITPPAIKKSWIDSIEYFDQNELSEKKLSPKIVLTTIGCLDNELETKENPNQDDFDDFFNQDDFGLVIVDESHRFRNNDTIMYQRLDDLIGECGAKVLLLSATPQNNAPYDLYHQISLFQREVRNSTLETLGEYGKNLESYFAEKQKRYVEYIKKDKKDEFGQKIAKTLAEQKADRENLISDSNDIRKRIVEPLIIRRTRTDIKKYYENDMITQGLNFPTVKQPIAIGYELGSEVGPLFNDTINIIAPEVSHVDIDENGNPILDFSKEAGKDALGYYRYRAIEYLAKEENRKRYESRNLTVEGTSKRLAQLMEMLLVKRLESSKSAFEESLLNLRRYTQNMIRMYEANRIFICPDLDVNKELSDDAIQKNGTFENCLDVLAEKAKNKNLKRQSQNQNPSNFEYTQKDFKSNYIELLKNDLMLIEDLCSKWLSVRDDVKLEKFIAKIDTFMDKKKNLSQKLVIFTECIATQKVIVKKLQNVSEYKILEITAANRDEMKEIIAANFDANYKEEHRNDYDIIITTDVLAEGVNLHRANTILNYDSPWNATRLMQRLGRINRIGSNAKAIYNYNFYPSSLGDNQINLKNRTYVKLQAFHELFGEDSQIYSTDEEVRSFEKVEHDFDDDETPIMPFISELKVYKEKNPADYERLQKINKCVSSIASETGLYFANLHVREKESNNFIKSLLYIVNKDGFAKKVGQLEFFELLKPLVQLEGINVDFDMSKRNQQIVLSKYDSDEKNKEVPVREKLKVGQEGKDDAIKKMQKFFEQELSSETEEMLDTICDGIRNSNRTLIKKVLSMNFDFNQLDFAYEEDIKYLFELSKPKKDVEEIAEVFIEFQQQ